MMACSEHTALNTTRTQTSDMEPTQLRQMLFVADVLVFCPASGLSFLFGSEPLTVIYEPRSIVTLSELVVPPVTTQVDLVS